MLSGSLVRLSRARARNKQKKLGARPAELLCPPRRSDCHTTKNVSCRSAPRRGLAQRRAVQGAGLSQEACDEANDPGLHFSVSDWRARSFSVSVYVFISPLYSRGVCALQLESNRRETAEKPRNSVEARH